MITANLPLSEISDLATQIQTQVETLTTTLDTLRTACQRDAGFTGSAATKYDEYMASWDTHQAGLVEALSGAGQLLASFVTSLDEFDETTGNAFSLPS